MKKNQLVVTALAVSLACLTNIASAQSTSAPTTPVQSTTPSTPAKHPRKTEVNNRLKNQNARIDKKVADGKMSKEEGNKLKRNDHEIRQEEKDMAKQNNGHITKQEQKTLNQQENKNSRKIKKH